MNPDRSQARIYHALAPGQIEPMTIAVRTKTPSPESFAPRLAEITTSLDPALRLTRVQSMDEGLRQEQRFMRLAAVGAGIVTLSVLLLSAAGIYALMSFAVVQRRREIGIRAALGANPRRILFSIFGRALAQLTAGVTVGIAIAARLDSGEHRGADSAVLPAIVVIVMMVGLLAAAGPARRSLRISSTEALREQ
jgi:ABC-type antimicrobial peptide transport system permease subunit